MKKENKRIALMKNQVVHTNSIKMLQTSLYYSANSRTIKNETVINWHSLLSNSNLIGLTTHKQTFLENACFDR